MTNREERGRGRDRDDFDREFERNERDRDDFDRDRRRNDRDCDCDNCRRRRERERGERCEDEENFELPEFPRTARRRKENNDVYFESDDEGRPDRDDREFIEDEKRRERTPRTRRGTERNHSEPVPRKDTVDFLTTNEGGKARRGRSSKSTSD